MQRQVNRRDMVPWYQAQRATIPTVPGTGPKRSYSRKEVCRLLNLSESVMETWESRDFVRKKDEYAFRDLLALRTLRELRRNRIRPDRIRRILDSLSERLEGIKNPLAELKIYVDGNKVAVQMGGGKMEPISGQLLLDFDHEEIRRLLEFPAGAVQKSHDRQRVARTKEAEVWFERGLEAERAGLPVERAVAAYQRAVDLDPGQAAAFVNLGTVYYHQSDWNRAEECYLKALAARPEYALAHFNLGNLFDEAAQWEKALEHYQAALDIQQDYPDAHYNIALLYQSHGDPLKAVRHWRAYLKLDPGGYWSAIARRELTRLRQETVVQGSRS